LSWEGPLNDYSNAIMYNVQYTLEEKYKDRVEKVIYAPADGDAQKQINTVEDMLTKDIDLLLYQPISESLGVATIEKAMSMGIPVIVFGASLLTEDYVSFCNIDLYGIGEATTDWICTQMGGKGAVLQMVGEPGSGYTEDFIKGSTAALKKYPEISLVNRIYAYYSTATAKQATETIINTTPDIGGIINQGGHMALGVLEAFNDKNLPLPYVLTDDINLFIRSAKEMNFTQFVCVSGGSEVSADACEIAMKVLNGESVKKIELSPVKLYTPEEMDALIPEGMSDGYWALNKIPKEFVKNYFK
ncbi:MAG: substrate-binding domain-containing protein, partial [Bacteroidales bacterium]|nr:substrate-binding domain-containing protein [Bacteroidales bacterium]